MTTRKTLNRLDQTHYVVKGLTTLALIPLFLAFSGFYIIFQITYQHAQTKFRSAQG